MSRSSLGASLAAGLLAVAGLLPAAGGLAQDRPAIQIEPARVVTAQRESVGPRLRHPDEAVDAEHDVPPPSRQIPQVPSIAQTEGFEQDRVRRSSIFLRQVTDRDEQG